MVSFGCVGDDPVVTTPDAGAQSGSSSSGSSSSGSSSSGGPTACEDATYCDDKCGAELKDKCGVTRDCSTPCGDGRRCDGLRCVCASSSTWCNGRCGDTVDNCNKPIVCGGCDGAPCDTSTNTCGGCIADPRDTTCAGKECGLAVNNCGQEIVCGACAGGVACKDNRCCDAPSVVCAGRCGAQKNSCGETVVCATPCCPNGRPLGDDSNCGGCGKDCSGFACDPVAGTCACDQHESNSDSSNCGPCVPSRPGPDCIKRNYAACVAGVCK